MLFLYREPHSSYVWNFLPILKLLEVASDVKFDQCMYSLQPPHVLQVSASTFHGKPNPLPCQSSKSHSKPIQFSFIRKPTTIRTNLSLLNELARPCSRDHEHFHCCGSVKTSNDWVSVAKAAGHYPLEVCTTWADLVRRAAEGKKG